MIVADRFIRHPRKAAGGVGSLIGKSTETDLDLGGHPLKKRTTCC